MVEGEHRDKARALLAELVVWVCGHGGDVDGDAFCDACRDIAFHARSAYVPALRMPAGIRPGVHMLDFACALLGTHVPSELKGFGGLPGMRLWLSEVLR